jgi:hypothetical protein
MVLKMFEYNPVPKPNYKRFKTSQRIKGAISPKVRKNVRERSRGVCELRMRCGGTFATEQAHLIGRKHIEHKTTEQDLLHVCTSCHQWLDATPEGIKWKKARVEQWGKNTSG